ncbi:unnamed protein product [Cryptosporidium hominis]|uniref:Uncharacterized protein n=1 Tax=Cryptosporidium hominis TaxID=237895 RepID=A0A0S4TFR6_CRYHO|nr:hypothetical protein [Cryptosporidium hominis TU502]OLQ18743.1 hypothetical protein ChTU502y2012_413g0040 [Cryptosporidium hominis]PPA63231.1 hypothetical protein ChUKH1_11675 [Cryptosporidium hominis]PPA65494.1 hypothetical protein ChUKH1_01165 [Cryptosporidium hominis]PPS93359.1 Uncharacterized protein GY17_00003693 [Cryptosporidium hominis]CUV05523.1 unnamed protein product [Cryptosporidium hominis]|eukprot:PPS93359.1 Uncharacterized protein GY17_00003693 [Cryptosporidium hominis]
MKEKIETLHTVITEKLGSELLSRALYILFLLKLVMLIGFGSYYFNKRKQEKAKQLNDMRMRKIRENQIKVWEKDISEYTSANSKNESSLEEDQKEENKHKKKSKLSWMSANSNSHLNPHFSHLSTYKPSVSKRYPCKKCCG